MSKVSYQYPQIFAPLFRDGPSKRRIVLHGGRGSGKSWVIAAYLLARAARQKLLVLCARQFQNSIADSVLSLLEYTIVQLGLEEAFEVGRTTITCPSTGSTFLFRGLQTNPHSIRSIEGIDVAWVEEAQALSELSLKSLEPTVRRANSQIIFSMNPTNETDPVWERYLSKWWEAHCGKREYEPDDDILLIRANWPDNPFLPEELHRQKDWDYERDELYAEHVWGGDPLGRPDRLIYPPGSYEVQDLDNELMHGMPLYGLDIGETINPTVLLRVWVPDARTIYVSDERVAWKLDAYSAPGFLRSMPGAADHPITSDHQWLQIHQLLRKEHGLILHHAAKGPGSVHEGIAFVRGHRLVINPRCKHLLGELKLYGLKIDKTTDEITQEIEKKHDHGPDALRYAIEPLRRRKRSRHVGVLAAA